MKINTKRTALCAAVVTLTLAACSTGGSGGPPPGSITTTNPSGGVYTGSLKGSATYATLLMLFDGTAYLFYGGPGQANLAGVAIARNGTQTSDGRFASSQAIDYRIGTAPAAPVAFMANFAHAPTVDGAVVNKDGSPDLAFTANATSMLDVAPTLSRVGGLYDGRGMSLGGATDTHITVTNDGNAAGQTSSGCEFRGTVASHPGVNAYDVSITFGPAPCPLPGVSVMGGAVLDGARLMVAVQSPDRGQVFLFDGRK